MACCLVTRVSCGGRGGSPDRAHCTRLVIHPNDEKLPEHKLKKSSKRNCGEKLTAKEITFRKGEKKKKSSLDQRAI